MPEKDGFLPKKRRRLPAERVMALGFLLIILTGSLLLMLPASSIDRTVTPFPDTLFTSVSATCVTGLVVVDTGTHWSLFGQCVILCMIQIGGLGFMSFALMLAGTFRQKASPRVRNLTAQSLGMDSVDGMQKFVRRIFCGTAVIEGTGALLLMLRTIPMLGFGRGVFAGIFISISAFCNAGFDPLGGIYGEFASLTNADSDPLLLLTCAALVILGAAGFLVWNDIWEQLRGGRKRGRRMSMYSRFILCLTAILLLGGTVLILFFEWDNPDTIGGMPFGEKLLQAFFQSVTTRTAGFDAIGQSAMTDCAKAVSMILMFVGGASGSTAGGIKVGTFGVLCVTVLSTLRGGRDINVMHRRLPHETVRRALCITFFVLSAVFVWAFLLCAANGCPLEDALYECFSAFCTVGLSLSLTPTLGAGSRMLLAAAMYCGRVGILTLSLALAGKEGEDAIAYPEAHILIG